LVIRRRRAKRLEKTRGATMCGPYGHAHVTDERQDDWDDEGTSGDPARLSPKDGGGPVGAVMDQLDEMIEKKPKPGFFGRWRERVWPHRVKLYGRENGKPRRKRLPSDRMLLAGYPWLNSHGEISVQLPTKFRVNGDLIPCGFDLADGELLLQRNRGHRGLPLTLEDLKEAREDWISAIQSAGGMSEFLLAHAGRLGDLAQWMEKFPQMVNGGYALSKMRGRVNKQRFQQWQADVITCRAIKGVWQEDIGITLLPLAATMTKEPDANGDVARVSEAMQRKSRLENRLTPAFQSLWGRNAYEAAETLCEHPNEFVAAMN